MRFALFWYFVMACGCGAQRGQLVDLGVELHVDARCPADAGTDGGSLCDGREVAAHVSDIHDSGAWDSGMGGDGGYPETSVDLCSDGLESNVDSDCSAIECGLGPKGEFCGLCASSHYYYQGAVFSLCPVDNKCLMPEADCSEGWCSIPPGTFQMGQVSDFYPPLTGVPVTITRPFAIMQTEVTQAEWLLNMFPTDNPSPFPACGADCPVSGMTFFDALRYANRLSESEGLPACYFLEKCEIPEKGHGTECEKAHFAGPDCPGYRLPTDAEWELAANASADTALWIGPKGFTGAICAPGDAATALGWYCSNCSANYEGCVEVQGAVGCCGPRPVAQKNPNPFGLYDTLGNVAEFTGTIVAPYYVGYQVDPGYSDLFKCCESKDGYEALYDGCSIIVKGGLFGTPLQVSYPHMRSMAAPTITSTKLGHFGFRLVRTMLP